MPECLDRHHPPGGGVILHGARGQLAVDFDIDWSNGPSVYYTLPDDSNPRSQLVANGRRQVSRHYERSLCRLTKMSRTNQLKEMPEPTHNANSPFSTAVAMAWKVPSSS
jgi:hypothetical protein